MTRNLQIAAALSLGAFVAVAPLLATRSDAKPAAKSAKSGKLMWRTSLSAAMAESKRTGKPIMADFYADWCGPCKELDQTTWKSAEVIKAARGFIPVKVNVDQNAALATKFKVTSIPAVFFINSRGKSVHNFVGYAPPAEAARIIRTAYRKAK